MKTKLLLSVGIVIVSNAKFAQDKWDTDGRIKYWLRSQIRPKIS